MSGPYTVEVPDTLVIKNGTLTFDVAFMTLMGGRFIRRLDWDPEECMSLRIDEYPDGTKLAVLQNQDGVTLPGVANVDLFAQDWQVLRSAPAKKPGAPDPIFPVTLDPVPVPEPNKE